MKITITIFLNLVFILLATAQVSSELTNESETAKVIAIHQVELKPEADLKEFESFIIDTILPLYKKVDGQDAFLVKGDRGNRIDKYAIVLTFTNVEVRDRIYPPSGGISENFEQILEGTDAFWEKLGTYTVGDAFGNHTDYVRVTLQE